MEITNLHQWYLTLNETVAPLSNYEKSIQKFHKLIKKKIDYNAPIMTGFYKKHKFNVATYILSGLITFAITLFSTVVLLTIFNIVKKQPIVSTLKLSLIIGVILGIIGIILHILLKSMTYKKLVQELQKQEKDLTPIIKTIPISYRTSEKIGIISKIYFQKQTVPPDKVLEICDEFMLENKQNPFQSVMFDTPFSNKLLGLEPQVSKPINTNSDDTDYEEEYDNPDLPGDIKSKTFEGSKDATKDLNDMIGLNSVKEQVHKLENRIAFYGSSSNGNHMAFKGSAGTGKTTIARIITKILYDLKIIKKNQYVEISGDYLRSGDTNRANAIIEYSMGGVLFIDEAYLLYDKNGSGADATGVLLKAMEDRRKDFVVILAGYEEQMTKLIASNEGFTSRIKHTIYFNDYTVEEMFDIFKYFISNYSGKSYTISQEATDLLLQTFDLEKKSKSFGNARTVRNAVDSIMDYYADRCIATHNNSNEIQIEDVQLYTNDRKVALQHELKNAGATSHIDENIISQSELKPKLKKGSENVKNDLLNMIGVENFQYELDLLRNQKEFYGKADKQKILFVGSTDCTNFVKVMTGTLYQLGYIQENKYLDISAEFLKGSYVGHTAKRAEAIISYASGGVLLIRNLNMIKDQSDSFSAEVLTAVNNALTSENDITIIVADTASDYIKSLESLFTIVFQLPVYNKEQLCSIFISMANQDGFTVDNNAINKLTQIVNDSMKEQDIVSLYNTAKKNHINNFTEETKFILLDVDIQPVKKLKINIKKGN